MENFVFKFESVGELGTQVGALLLDFFKCACTRTRLVLCHSPRGFLLASHARASPKLC
ncbi:hypothetical protein HBZS_119930 [Helicobacter bizzozeronii CCUG 35545]|nr:hypothetical protein HBZS_119930 [Helicobacter bizzozeronii CCUG 35545]